MHWTSVWPPNGLQLQPYLELGSAALLCQMVERGMGLSFLPEYIVRAALAAGTLARLNVPDCGWRCTGSCSTTGTNG